MSSDVIRELVRRADDVFGRPALLKRYSPQLVPGVVGLGFRPGGDILGVSYDTDERRGLSRTVGEAYERFAYLSASATIGKMGNDEAIASGIEMLAPETVTRFSPGQLALDQFAGFRWNERVSRWTEASTVDDVSILVPEELLLARDDHRSAPVLRPRSTVGTALHDSPSEARERALLEVVERDGLARVFYGLRRLEPISSAAFEGSSAVDACRKRGVRMHLGYVHASSDALVAVCFVELPQRPHTLFAGGSSVRSTLEGAIEAAVLEAVQGLHVQQQHLAVTTQTMSAHHRALSRRARHWATVGDGQRARFLERLFNADRVSSDEDRLSIRDQESLRRGRDAYWLDITPPSIDDIVSVQRCVVPWALSLPADERLPFLQMGAVQGRAGRLLELDLEAHPFY